ncbi:hypothetical protein [Acinetobacter sp. WCHAc010052]|uniref:hypothetical protein n=1 Tax=Acinetobacter sp. WCHAc010052 TaxID=2004647 RepID=UPI000B3D3CB9|nr:hypothetical protein [Acinetobacter sp. WCHAc010052]AXY60223.1 hypothetical protein CDG61_09410 [Acinetobacter sp. WCHAc010052]
MNAQYKPFGFNPESAAKADSSNRIEEAGKYVGVIKHMEFVTSRNTGTVGFEIEFETDSKESTTISVWTAGVDGKPFSGTNKINALLACVGLKGLTPTNGQLEKYDFDSGERKLQNCIIAPEVAGRRVGFLLQRENYKNSKGENKHVMNFFSVFHPDSELMAKEILDRKTVPEALPKSLHALMSNPVTTRKPKNNNGSFQQNNSGYGGYQQNNGGYGQQSGYQDDGFPPVLDDHQFGGGYGNSNNNDFPY